MGESAPCHGPTQIDVGTKGPLRKVVNRSYRDSGLEIDVLECGHVLNASMDRNDDRNYPGARYCWKCRDERQEGDDA